MSAYPVMLDGSKLTAVVVGGGRVATRKVRALLGAGAEVRVVAIAISPELEELSVRNARVSIAIAEYAAGDIGDAMLVVAATDDPLVNLRVADDANRAGRLVNVVDAPSIGTFTTPAVHRTGDLTIAVSCGRIPAAAVAIRDTVARRFDERYAAAIVDLRELRERLLARGDHEAWRAVSAEIFDADFCISIESGTLPKRTAPWR